MKARYSLLEFQLDKTEGAENFPGALIGVLVEAR